MNVSCIFTDKKLNYFLVQIFTISLCKKTRSLDVDRLCLSANEEFDIIYCCCEIGKGISSEVERDTARCGLFLRVRGGFKIVSFELVIF